MTLGSGQTLLACNPATIAPEAAGRAPRPPGSPRHCSTGRPDVLRGFVVPALVYRTFRDHTHLAARLHLLLDGLDVDDGDELQAVAAQVQSALCATRIPEQLAVALTAAYAELSPTGVSCRVAVWSPNAPVDHLQTSPHAQSAHVSTVQGPEQTLDAIRRCWSSIFDARTLYYRGQLGVDLARMATSVIVQRIAR